MISSFSHRYLIILFVLFGMIGCKSSEKFSGFSYDPAGATETSTKQINRQHKRTIGFESDGVWASNEFAEARLSDFYRANDTLYQAVIRPENAPINDSPWYAFKVWARQDTTVWVRLSYEDGHHRYLPKLSTDKTNWQRIEPQNYKVNKDEGSALMKLHLTQSPLWISAQELLGPQWFAHWADSLSTLPYVSLDTVGQTHQQRPIQRLRISKVPKGNQRGVLIITGRLHPPEVTGSMACEAFIETLTSNSELAQQFRQHFEILAYPFANPDGVANGHWRNNAGGVDLNRDWQNFNQPETQAIRDDLLKQLKGNPNAKVYYGIDFHSTGSNIFYPINRDIQTFPENFTYHWIDDIKKDFPKTEFSVEPFDTSAPIAKNWIYSTFGADALTYEVADTADRATIRAVAQRSAQLVMKQLLEVVQNQ